MPFAHGLKPSLALALILVPTFAIAAPTARPSRDFGGEEALERLRAADTNKDGAITRRELLAHRVKEWPRLDRNGDGIFSKHDLPGFAKDRWDSGRLVTLRQTYDTNRDGRISRAEFTSGPTPAFDLADSNRDNRVTEAEIRTAIADLKRI
jgi:hypothetical protein